MQSPAIAEFSVLAGLFMPLKLIPSKKKEHDSACFIMV